MVKSGSNICELCGGTANTGGIGFTNVTYLNTNEEGNCVLPNGIIVINEAKNISNIL